MKCSPLTAAALPALAMIAFVPLSACQHGVSAAAKEELGERPAATVETAIGPLTLPSPYSSESVSKGSKTVGWPADKGPQAPAGFVVDRYVEGLEGPRRTYLADNGDLFVVESATESSANRISRLRAGADGKVTRTTFVEGLNKPYGMLALGDYFYVANTDGVYRYPYTVGQETLDTASATKIVALPAGGYNNHWTRNLLASPDREHIYVSVGSASNCGEHGMDIERDRAGILVINLDGSGKRVYASGLRNPVGMDWNPQTGELWTAVNERDALGNELVPDYATSVREGAFYGWPFSYYGQLPDPRWAEDPHPEQVAEALVPDVPLGAHTASLGLAFYPGDGFGDEYKNGAFVGQHGSWNRAKFSGYKVVFIPFDDAGKPQPPQDFLTGFIADEAESTVHGRPVGVTVMPDGALLVCDDTAGIIWRVQREG